MVKLTEQEVQEIISFLGEIPYKYSSILIMILHQKLMTSKQEVENKDETKSD